MDFKVTLTNKDNPDQFMFLTVEDCKDTDELVDHIWDTQPEWDIHSFGPA